MPATIDILLPVYNGAAYLGASIDSVLRQTFGQFRLLVLDDGSTDGSLGIARAAAAVDPRIVVVALPHRGLVETLNHGLELVDAPYVGRQDADDVSLPARLAIQLAALERRPEICALSGPFYEMDAAGTALGLNRWHGDPALADPFAVPAREPYLSHPFLMARTAALRAVGGYRHILHSEDADLYWRLTLHGKLANLDDVLGFYRQHATSVSALSLHNAMVQSFSAQVAALSYRRLASGRPDIVINRALADRIDGCATIEAMVASVPGLDGAEQAWLRCAAYAKTIETAGIRRIAVDFDLLRAAIAAYPASRRALGRRAHMLARRIRRGLRLYARQSRRSAAASFGLGALLAGNVLRAVTAPLRA